MSSSGLGHEHEHEPITLPPPKRTLLRRFTSWIEHAHALKAWVARAGRHSPALDATFETIEHDSDIGGVMLAGALSYRLFVFALPLAFFVVSGLGLLASALGKEPHLVVNSIGLAAVVTQQISDTAKGSSNWWVAVTSFFALVYATRVLMLFNILILGNLIKEKTTTYGALGTAATLLLAFFLVGRVMAGAAVLNATLYERKSRVRDRPGKPRRSARARDAGVRHKSRGRAEQPHPGGVMRRSRTRSRFSGEPREHRRLREDLCGGELASAACSCTCCCSSF